MKEQVHTGLNKHGKRVIIAKTVISQGVNDAIILFGFEKLLDSLGIGYNVKHEYSKDKMKIELQYNYANLKEKLKKFRGKKLI